jgi:hypothetical protein
VSKRAIDRQDDQVLAALAHASIALGPVVTSLDDRDFKYLIIGNWLASQE